ncbi:MAG: diguanylate cyclase, partial [Akkermansiaceae bacterium]|nr:diguanylate cyclase [Akkermansiaceae bacterium]
MGYDWPVVTPRRVLGRRDTPTIQFFALWIGSLAASVLLGLASIEFDWSGIPIKAFGLETFVTIYPPLIFCTLLTIWFGFLWGFVPAYLATLLLALRSGMPFEWSVLFAFADPLGLLILWFGFRFARIDPSLRGWRPCVLFALLCFFGALLGSSGSFIW